MERTQYLEYRKRGSVEPMYEYYKEFKDPGKKLLDVHEFIKAINEYPFSEQCNKVACAYYDAKFFIVKITNKLGGLIRYE